MNVGCLVPDLFLFAKGVPDRHLVGEGHFDFVRTAKGKSGTFGGFTVVGVCCPWVKALTRSET